MATSEEFTEKDQQTLNDLTLKRLKSEWRAREAKRVEALEKTKGLAAVLTVETADAIAKAAHEHIEALGTFDRQKSDLLFNVANVMGYSGVEVARMLEQLNTPEPEPTLMPPLPAQDEASQ